MIRRTIDLSTQAIEIALRPLGDYLACDQCNQLLRERINNLVALWSIRASSPGRYALVFNAKIDRPSSKAETFSVRFFPSDNLTVSVVREWDDYFNIAFGPFVTFMGSLLTLPGIISFVENRRRKGQEQKRAI